jgi:fatty acid desaturase
VRHHATENLTDPGDDPESQYLSGSDWCDAGPVVRALRRCNMTLAGRLLLGPWIVAAAVVKSLGRQWALGRRRWSIVRFGVADLAVLAVVWSTGLPLWQYVLGAAYLGTSLTLVRSYAEHRAVAEGSRTAVVLGRGFWALLFLNNNLHVTHHRRPELAWYRLPAAHAASDADRVASDGAGLYRSYAEVFRRYLFHQVSSAVDPLDRGSSAIRT